jgi:RimJ/RimL family protein N-acetyltransferase
LAGLPERWVRFPEKADKGLLYSLRQYGVVTAAAVLPHRWRILECTDLPVEAPTPLLVDLLARSAIPIGVVAPLETALGVGKAWRALTGGSARPRVELGCYTLDEVPVWPLPDAALGTLRLPRENEVQQMCDWGDAFRVECNLPGDAAVFRRTRIEQIERHRLVIWADADSDQALAQASFSAVPPEACRIGSVYTPPALRGRGHASHLVAALSRQLMTVGAPGCDPAVEPARRIFLNTDLGNPTSNAIYQRIGFRRGLDLAHIGLEPTP